MTDVDDPELLARREAVGHALEQARYTVVSLWIVMSAVAWLGFHAGLVWQPGTFLGLGLANGLWRMMAVPRFGDAMKLTAQRVMQVERQVQANMLFSGLSWAFGSLAIYPHLAPAEAMVYVSIVVGNVSAAAFLTSTVGLSYPLLAVPSMLSLLAWELYRGGPNSLLLAALLTVYLVVMLRAGNHLRATTLLSFLRGHEMAQTNRVMQQAMVDAEAAARAKTRFLATMSHELRTPLNGLTAALELVARSELQASQRRLVDIARSSGSGLLAVLDDVLDYAKLDAEQPTIRALPTDLRALVQSAIDLYSASALAKHLVLRSEVDPAVPGWVLVDAQRLRQVLLNLVGNAVKFTDRGEVLLRLRGVAEGLRFEVRDTGIGIAAASQGELFEPFHQVHADSNRSHGGTGLGLAISQRLVQAMGGQIDVQSGLGEGACFGFTLALPPAPAPQDLLPDATGQASALPRLQGTVLLVEDNEVNRLLAVELLQLLQLEVQVAEDGAQALAMLPQCRCDLVLMDCQMPGIDGYQATRQWRRQEQAEGRKRLPVLALTASLMADDMDLARDAGMDGFLGKPYTVEQLAELLQRWLPARAPTG